MTDISIEREEMSEDSVRPGRARCSAIGLTSQIPRSRKASSGKR